MYTFYTLFRTGGKRDVRRLSEGDRASFEKESFKIIQNQGNDETCHEPEQPSSTRFGKGVRNRRVSNVERNNLEEETTIGNQFRCNLQKYRFKNISAKQYEEGERAIYLQ